MLLVDGSSSAKRELRAQVMRKLGIDVDCAADIPEARCWWKADLYDLVLLNVDKDGGHRDRFCDDIRTVTPPQQLAFLVGKPEYLANSPHLCDELAAAEASHGQDSSMTTQAAVTPDPQLRRQYWGIMEASRRISAVRSASVARTQAIRRLPAPCRDSDGQRSKRAQVPSNLGNFREEAK